MLLNLETQLLIKLGGAISVWLTVPRWIIGRKFYELSEHGNSRVATLVYKTMNVVAGFRFSYVYLRQ